MQLKKNFSQLFMSATCSSPEVTVGFCEKKSLKNDWKLTPERHLGEGIQEWIK